MSQTPKSISTGTPKATIGLPVYNGENYLRESIDSILAQTFTDFELIISDNASTDQTEAICRAYVAADPRVHYTRNETNLGASRNYNQLVSLARGQYFKWGAHDDLCAPQFLERCVQLLDQDESIVIAHTKVVDIDDQGKVIRYRETKPDLNRSKAAERFYQCICVPHPQTAVFGLIRTDVLRKTRLIGAFSSSDRILLGELALYGRFQEVPDYLFFKRHHAEAHWKKYPTRRLRLAWYDPARAHKISFPHWRLLREHLISIYRTPLDLPERVQCHLVLGWWMRKQWKKLAKNLVLQG